MRTAIACLARLLLALGLAAGAIACGGPRAASAVTILIPWDPITDKGEFDAFKAVTDQFTQDTGIPVKPQVTRDVAQQLNADLAVHDPPDIADFSGPGALDQFKNNLQPLRIDLKPYAQPWRGLAALGTGTVYAIPVKADVQSLIWYRTSAVSAPPTTWAALQELSQRRGTPWCLGLASGAVSGWPGASWIADILLSRYGVDKYKAWLSGALRWNTAQVRDAFQEWGKLLGYGKAVNGGVSAALNTSFNRAFAPGQCVLEHGALIATGLTKTAGYSYVPFPSISRDASVAPALVSGDFMGLFTDNPGAKQLLSYLASPNYLASRNAQALWVSQDGGDAFSADQTVPLASYPKGVRRDIAGLLQPSAGITLCFAAGDLMSPDVSAAFSQAVLEYLNKPASLDGLLQGLQKTQHGAGSSPLGNSACYVRP